MIHNNVSLAWTNNTTEQCLAEPATQHPGIASGRSPAAIQMILYIFLYLQVLDLLTTLVGFKLGISEASPFVRVLMHFNSAFAVVISKIVALGLAGLFLSLKRSHLIRWVNYWYAAIIIWNLCNILSV